MAWQTPVTDRANTATRTTADDMNRIDGNINYLWATLLKSDFTPSNIVTLEEWTGVIDTTNEIADLLGMEHVTDSTDYANFNRIEAVAKAYWDLLPLWPAEILYPAEDLYPR